MPFLASFSLLCKICTSPHYSIVEFRFQVDALNHLNSDFYKHNFAIHAMCFFLQSHSSFFFGQWSKFAASGGYEYRIYIVLLPEKKVRILYLKSPAETYTFILIFKLLAFGNGGERAESIMHSFSLILALFQPTERFCMLFNHHWTESQCYCTQHLFICLFGVVVFSVCVFAVIFFFIHFETQWKFSI